MSKKVLIIGADPGIGSIVIHQLHASHPHLDVHFIDLEQMDKDRSLTFSRDHFTVPDINQIMIVEPEPFVGPHGFPIPGMAERIQELLLPEKQMMELLPNPKFFTPPLTRRERRANARNLKK